jgi:hypothetical protein
MAATGLVAAMVIAHIEKNQNNGALEGKYVSQQCDPVGHHI